MLLKNRLDTWSLQQVREHAGLFATRRNTIARGGTFEAPAT